MTSQAVVCMRLDNHVSKLVPARSDCTKKDISSTSEAFLKIIIRLIKGSSQDFHTLEKGSGAVGLLQTALSEHGPADPVPHWPSSVQLLMSPSEWWYSAALLAIASSAAAVSPSQLLAQEPMRTQTYVYTTRMHTGNGTTVSRQHFAMM